MIMITLRRTVVGICILCFVGMGSVVQGQYYFGRNKIQYNRFRWHVLKTQHFDIYFYPEMESLAEMGAFFAEASYRHLQDRFNHNVLRRIPLVFYSSHFHFEETNTLPYLIPPGLGGFFEFMKGRVVVPSDGSIPRFRQTIQHELVHVFQRSYVQRVLKDHSRLRYGDVPLWFVEGLAEYWSDGWSSEAEMFIRDAVLNDYIVPIDQMYRIWGTFLMYKEGQAILKFIADRYGEEKILQLLDNAWTEEDFSDVMKFTIGKDYKELSEEWIYDLKKSRYPLMADQDLPRMVTTRITDKGFNTLPAFYREGKTPMVVFMANRDGYSSIYQKPLADYRKAKPKILVKGERTPELEAFNIQKSRIDVDALGRLAFVAKSGQQDVLYIYDIREGRVVREYRLSGLVSLFSPAWSPDGDRIVLTGLDQAGRSDLYVVRLEDGSLTRLTDDFYEDMDADWSPDGRWLVFSSDRTEQGNEGNRNLFLYDLESNRIRYLTFGAFQDRNPVWSPDGRFIAFSSDRDGVPNVWVIQGGVGRQDGGGVLPVYSLYETGAAVVEAASLKQVTQFATGAIYPCWTDSLTLLFTAFENYGFQIRALSDVEGRIDSVRGVEPVPLTKAPEVWTFPRISGSMETSRVKYKRKFSLDFAQSRVVQDPIFGTSGGGELIVTDMLGNEQYYFLIYNNARAQSEFWNSFNFAVTRVDLSRRVNYALGLYRLAGRYYNNYEGFFYENRYGGFGAVSYPLNKFERLETSINLRQSEKEWSGLDRYRKAFLVSNFISYTKDNSLWGPTGPLDGGRYNITLGNTVDIKQSNVNFTTVMVDLRKYFRLGYRMCHAVRVLGQFNQGKEALPFFMGGSWDLRGYKLWSLWGTKLVLISNELRFPFIDNLYLGFPFGGVGFSSIRGALFVDAGNAWDDAFDEVKGSLGFGVRLRVGGYLVLRLDIGKKTNFKEIYPRTFTQFFFGWDF